MYFFMLISKFNLFLHCIFSENFPVNKIPYEYDKENCLVNKIPCGFNSVRL